MSFFLSNINELIEINYQSLIIDINECELNIHSCHEQATCTNSPGSYSCACNPGWTGDGFDCQGSQIIFEQRNLPSPDFHSPHYEY